MRFDEYYLIESVNMAPGFSKSDTESIDEFLKDELGTSSDIGAEEEIKDADVKPVDINDLRTLKMKQYEPPKKDREFGIADRPQKMIHKSTFFDENGKLLTNNQLRKVIEVRPKKLISQNGKMVKSGIGQIFYDFSIPAYQGLYVDEATGEFRVVRTCPAAGECKKFCYASKGSYVKFPVASLATTRVINYLMNDYDGFKNQLITEIRKLVKLDAKKGLKVVLRWHDSGDFLSPKYLDMAFDIARATPEVLHYTYSKQIPLVKSKMSEMPKNFKITFSKGGVFDELIDTKKDTFADVVPFSLFKDLKYTKGEDNYSVHFAPEEIEELKKRVSEHFKINPKNLITYDEMQKIKDTGIKKYYVLVWKGNGDDAASRSDVKGIFLFFH